MGAYLFICLFYLTLTKFIKKLQQKMNISS